ncbi:putative killing protein suppressor (fragment) [Xenorhabdus nematophila str. Anatoliense]
MVYFLQNDSNKFMITEAVFRFGADVRSGDDPREAQLRMIRDGEAMPVVGDVSQKENEHEELSEHSAESTEDEQS